MSMTTAEALAEVFQAKLETITIASGKQTDIGLRVYRGRRQITVDRIPSVIIVEGDDRPADDDKSPMTRQVLLNQHYVFEGFAFGDPDNPNDIAHKIIRDLKRVIFADDPVLKRQIKWLRYAGRNIGVREDGTSIVSAYIEVDVGFLEDLQSA